MALHVVRLPDVGEGVAEAELVEWRVGVGDPVNTDSVLAEVMTDKATVEIVSPVTGTVTFRHGEPGDILAIGSDLVGVELAGADAQPAATAPPPSQPDADETSPTPVATPVSAPATAAPPSSAGEAMRSPSSAPRPKAAPAVRQRARELGIDLRLVRGTGPDGRISHADLDAFTEPARSGTASFGRDTSTTTSTLRGIRRRTAEKMTTSWSRIPHITYVDEVDVTDLEELRTMLVRRAGEDRAKLSMLPFFIRALVLACRDQPVLNSTFDDGPDGSGTLTTYGGLHVGIATQSPNGLMVPVVRHAEALDLWETASELARLTAAARAGQASRDELSGSTITITSLGALGGLATTPILNHPEVAIIGVNKMQIRPVWKDGAFVPRTMMNLSSSFDHRIVDGWVAATFVQRIKELLEHPALLFVGDPSP